MRLLVILISVVLAGPAWANDAPSRVVEGCLATISAYSGRSPDPINVIEDFSELAPPRARIRYGAPWEMVATCDFTNRESPLDLVEFCHEMACYSEGRRFDEINLLLEKAGF